MKTDSISARGRAPLFASVTLVCAGALLSGCMSSPTYGTGKTANQQLLEDLSSVLSLGPADTGPEIAYNPRPGLVRPTSMEVLPEPQQELASAENPAWPESPEERRRRIRAEATENQDNPAYRSPVRAGSLARGDRSGDGVTTQLTPSERAELERRMRENRQGDPAQRRYLSDPPLEYRVPSETAAVGELGEDEWQKERRLRRASGGSSWRDFIPWL